MGVGGRYSNSAKSSGASELGTASGEIDKVAACGEGISTVLSLPEPSTGVETRLPVSEERRSSFSSFKSAEFDSMGILDSCWGFRVGSRLRGVVVVPVRFAVVRSCSELPPTWPLSLAEVECRSSSRSVAALKICPFDQIHSSSAVPDAPLVVLSTGTWLLGTSSLFLSDSDGDKIFRVADSVPGLMTDARLSASCETRMPGSMCDRPWGDKQGFIFPRGSAGDLTTRGSESKNESQVRDRKFRLLPRA